MDTLTHRFVNVGHSLQKKKKKNAFPPMYKIL